MLPLIGRERLFSQARKGRPAANHSGPIFYMAKISLCLIAGNVEEYIDRCLLSFAPIADEIIVVRAIGCLDPDRTLEISRDKFGARTAEYKNQPGHEDWPHVDDFAAARQMSFDLSTGDYCFWVDTDDILKTGAERIRRQADEGGFACYLYPYEIFGKNVVVPRERMILRGAGRWRQPVHEAFKFDIEPVTAAMDDAVIVQHLPHLTKLGSNERNLRILEAIPEADLTVGLQYHLFGELMGANRKKEGIPLAIKLLTESELGKDERYDLLMSLVLQTTELERQSELLHAAHKTDPERREALGVLACVMMDLGRPEFALAYARQMAATMRPDIQSWNSRHSFYGYIGDDIFAQALRVNGRFEDAERVRVDSVTRHGGPRIALLHATRGRPELAARCRKAWHDLAVQPGRIEHIFAIDADDPASAVLRRFHHVIVPPGGGGVRAWNFAAQVTSAPILVQLSDDWIPIPKWDDLIVDRLGDVNEPRVLAISDGHRVDQLLCMAIVTRAWLAEDFFLFHPWFTGVFSDNWFTETAYARQQVIQARDIVFDHQHPAFGCAELDATYLAQNSPERYAQGAATLARIQTRTDWSTIPGFFNFWPVYEEFARQLQNGDTAIEIGVWLGRSIIYLAQELQRQGKTGVRLFALDNFQGEMGQVDHLETVAANNGNMRPAFEENLARCGVADMITIVDSDSAAAASQFSDGSMAMVFIDAAHEYEPVCRDLRA